MRNNKKLSTISGIVAMIILFSLAFSLPRCFFAYYDGKSKEEIAYLDVEVDAYRVQYSSMAEKIEDLANENRYGDEVEITLLQEIDNAELLAELTNRVNVEQRDFFSLNSSCMENCMEDELISCKLYTTVPKGEMTSDYQSISFWRMEYQTELSQVVVLLDVDFEKIYAISVETDYEKYVQNILEMMQEDVQEEAYDEIWLEETRAELEKVYYTNVGIQSYMAEELFSWFDYLINEYYQIAYDDIIWVDEQMELREQKADNLNGEKKYDEVYYDEEYYEEEYYAREYDAENSYIKRYELEFLEDEEILTICFGQTVDDYGNINYYCGVEKMFHCLQL